MGQLMKSALTFILLLLGLATLFNNFTFRMGYVQNYDVINHTETTLTNSLLVGESRIDSISYNKKNLLDLFTSLTQIDSIDEKEIMVSEYNGDTYITVKHSDYINTFKIGGSIE